MSKEKKAQKKKAVKSLLEKRADKTQKRNEKNTVGVITTLNPKK